MIGIFVNKQVDHKSSGLLIPPRLCRLIVGFDWAVDSCSWMSRCHLFFSRLSLAVNVGVRDEEAMISRLSPWLCLWQRDSTVQVRTARTTQWQTHTLYSSATQQNRTNHEGAFLGSQPSVQITAQKWTLFLSLLSHHGDHSSYKSAFAHSNSHSCTGGKVVPPAHQKRFTYRRCLRSRFELLKGSSTCRLEGLGIKATPWATQCFSPFSLCMLGTFCYAAKFRFYWGI